MDGPADGDTTRQDVKPVTVSNIKAPPIYIAFAIQFLICVIAALVSYLLLDTVAAYSVLLGGLICTVANAYFGSKAFRFRGARATRQIVRAIYQGEAIKLLLIFAGFGLGMVYVKPLNILAFFLGFIVVHIAGLIALIFVLKIKVK